MFDGTVISSICLYIVCYMIRFIIRLFFTNLSSRCLSVCYGSGFLCLFLFFLLLLRKSVSLSSVVTVSSEYLN